MIDLTHHTQQLLQLLQVSLVELAIISTINVQNSDDFALAFNRDHYL